MSDILTRLLLKQKSCVLEPSQLGLVVKNPSVNAEDRRNGGLSLSRKDPLKEFMATHSSILALRIPWTEEIGVLQSTGLQRVGHD